MNATRSALLVLITVCFAASCSYVPRMRNESPETANLRSQYLSSHPNGPHNEQIQRGEVTKGMDAMEVVASWGIPERRTGRLASKEELWRYTARDEHSGDFVIYELVLVNHVLKGCNIDRGTTGVGVVFGDGDVPVGDTLSLPNNDAFRSGSAPRK